MCRNRASERTLRAEGLESRQMLAGDVAVEVVDGRLRIEGDEVDNQIEVVQGEVEGTYLITGLSGEGEDAEVTLINGVEHSEDNPLAVEGVRHGVSMTMGEGSDFVALMGFEGEQTPAEEAEGEADDASRLFRHRRGPAIRVSLGNGDDEFVARNLQTPSLHVRSGDGNDLVDISDSTIRRGVSIGGGEGDDTVSLSGVEARRAFISTGIGEDVVTLVDSVFNVIGAHLGAGEDTLDVSGVTALRGVYFNGGEGIDTLNLGEGNDFARQHIRNFEIPEETPVEDTDEVSVSSESDGTEAAVLAETQKRSARPRVLRFGGRGMRLGRLR